jgi:hypothetical protein
MLLALADSLDVSASMTAPLSLNEAISFHD